MRPTSSVIGPIIAVAVIAALLASCSAWPSAPSFANTDPSGRPDAATQSAAAGAPWPGRIPRDGLGRAPIMVDDALTEDDGLLPSGVTPFDSEYPGVARLDPDLLRALRAAATAAADAGARLTVTSGWRSRDYQDQLFRDAVAKYGSAEEAARWAAPADSSAHVSGDAVDIGPADALAWLRTHGAKFGLCQIYRNEPWHYELRREAIEQGCPPMFADSSDDQRLER